jgi:hypothetical protein
VPSLQALRNVPVPRPKGLHVMRVSGAALMLMGLACAGASAAVAADNTRSIAVEWGNSEIKDFVSDQARGLRPSLLPNDEAKLARLKLPVLGFAATPSAVANSFGVDKAPAPQRNLVIDDDNPVWYSLVERYDDITIVVDADLRLQGDMPPGAKVYAAQPQPGGPVEVSVIDSASEPGLEGAIAEFTVYKYPNIPYRVTIECTKKSREVCRNAAGLAKDVDLLKLISARPPK